MPKTPEEMLAEMIVNLPVKTGRPLEEWLGILSTAGVEKHGEMMKLLKTDYGVSHGYANQIALRALALKSPVPEGETGLVDAQFAGPKSAIRPVYEAIIKAVSGFGSDVDISPKKTCVSLRRNKQFALIQASTATRIDVGIQLKGVEPQGRLEPSGSFNAMVSHRVRVGGIEEVDSELVGWLRQAYEAA